VKPTSKGRFFFCRPERDANSMKTKLVEGVFWGAVMGVAFAAGLIGISGFAILLLLLFAAIAGILRLRLLSWASNQMPAEAPQP
jgi:hypothetical protein